ncbi:MAG TPA: GNAT family protein [Chitinispirillaceae bacterium]|nr:GNAT family protein [Chitinispirillaceae bacterium]
MDCKIRPWRMDDAKSLATVLNNRKILDNLRDGIPFPYTIRDAEEYISAMISANKDTTYAFAITLDDKVIGSIGAFGKDNIHFRTAETGYYISESYWGRGLGTSAVKQLCKYIFDNTGIIRLFAEPFAENVASCRILEKSGFICEGILRKNAFKNGKILDMKLYALIKN